MTIVPLENVIQQLRREELLLIQQRLQSITRQQGTALGSLELKWLLDDVSKAISEQEAESKAS